MKSPQKPVTKPDKYRRLLDEFYEQNRDTVSQEDYETAREDPMYFKALVRRLTDLYQKIGRELFMNDRNYHEWEKEFRRQK